MKIIISQNLNKIPKHELILTNNKIQTKTLI